jgi:hypothetical protein
VAQELLPGEQLLWSGQPGRAGIRPADAVVSLYVVVGVAVVTVFALRFLHRAPGLIRAFVLLALAWGIVQAVVALIRLAQLPGQRRQTVYQVTDYRIVVTSGLSARHCWSAFLDQVAEPVVRNNRDGTADVVLRAGSGPAVLRLLNGLSGAGPFSALGHADVPALESLPDAASIRQIIADARQHVLSALGEAVPAPASPWLAPGPVPAAAAAADRVVAGLALQPGEQVQWTGCPEQVPWWFGSEDIGLSAFGLVWLAAAALIGWLSVANGSVAFLIFLVPMALAGGGYPAIGRVLHRRLRIRRSRYVVTDRRVAVMWQLGSQPVIVQQPLRRLLPPEICWRSVVTGLARPDPLPRPGGWANLLWPASTIGLPALVGLADPVAARAAIAAGQIAARRPAAPGG